MTGKKLVVCIVSDGGAKVNSRTPERARCYGVAYQEGIAKTKIGNKVTTAHIYEYTTQISVTPSRSKRRTCSRSSSASREKNQKKIDSHRWFFNASGLILQPNVCVLHDVGTMPGPHVDISPLEGV